ncbi:MAG: response regulator [Acidimicrobiia bacterium]|nr:response regulator [Acidimicrobiia bacterium]
MDVLIADDHEDVRTLLATVLELDGHEVTIACDGEMAVETALASPPDVIVMDVMMPKLDGVSATRQLRQATRTAGVPVILLSGKADAHAVSAGLAAGAARYITKPFEPADLLAELTAVAGGGSTG